MVTTFSLGSDHGVCRAHRQPYQLGFLVDVTNSTLKYSASNQDSEPRYSTDKLDMSRNEALARNEAAVQNPTWNLDDKSPLQTWINETKEQEPWRGNLTNHVGGYSVHNDRLLESMIVSAHIRVLSKL